MRPSGNEEGNTTVTAAQWQLWNRLPVTRKVLVLGVPHVVTAVGDASRPSALGAAEGARSVPLLALTSDELQDWSALTW